MKSIIMVLLLLINVYSSDYEDHDEDHIDKELSHLNLSNNQNDKIKIFLENFRDELKDYRKSKKDIEAKRALEFLKEDLNINNLQVLNKSIDKKARDIENKLLKDIHSILSKKQKRRFVKYFDDWKVR